MSQSITFEKLSPQQFEELCFELVYVSGFTKIQWRRGGADRGRDIQAVKIIPDKLVGDYQETWFFECKHYKKGIGPEDLHSKITWADAEKPSHLVFFVSSYLTVPCREWLDKVRAKATYSIDIVEGPELIKIVEAHPSLVRKFFEIGGLLQLVEEAQKNWVIHGIMAEPSVVGRVFDSDLPLSKYSLENLAFLICSFYFNYNYLMQSKDWLYDFDESGIHDLIHELLERPATTTPLINEKTEYHVIGDRGVAYYEDDEVYNFNAHLFQIAGNSSLYVHVIKRLEEGAIEIMIKNSSVLDASYRFIKDYNIDYYRVVTTCFNERDENIEKIMKYNILML